VSPMKNQFRPRRLRYPRGCFPAAPYLRVSGEGWVLISCLAWGLWPLAAARDTTSGPQYGLGGCTAGRVVSRKENGFASHWHVPASARPKWGLRRELVFCRVGGACLLREC
jgi:hypothetical protein